MNKKDILKLIKIWILGMYMEAWVGKVLFVLHNINLNLETPNSA